LKDILDPYLYQKSVLRKIHAQKREEEGNGVEN
jgi:hypothetical protein